MSLTLTIELSDADLTYFIEALQKARQKVSALTDRQIIDAAQKLLADSRSATLPAFIALRLAKLEALIAMVDDAGWALPQDDRIRVLAALAYFAEREDLIPDDVVVIGFLDDAIVVELCLRELKHELDAYEDFCDYRAKEAARLGADPSSHSVQRRDWLEGRRQELQDRMRRRRRDSYYGGRTIFKIGGSKEDGSDDEGYGMSLRRRPPTS